MILVSMLHPFELFLKFLTWIIIIHTRGEPHKLVGTRFISVHILVRTHLKSASDRLSEDSLGSRNQSAHVHYPLLKPLPRPDCLLSS